MTLPGSALLGLLGWGVWSLIGMEGPIDGVTLQGQFGLDRLDDSGIRNNIITSSTYKAPTYFFEFINSGAAELKFTAFFFAKDAILGKVGPKIDTLKKFARPDAVLKRPMKCIFKWGNHHIEQVIIRSVTNIVWRDLTILNDPRQVTCEVTLLKWKAHPLNVIPTLSPDTIYYMAERGDTYESIAIKFYKNPMFGIGLRRYNREKWQLSIGTVIKVPLASNPVFIGEIKPISIPLAYVDKHPEFLTSMAKRRLQNSI